MSYALKLGGAAIAILLLGLLGILIFDAIWMRVGLGAAIVVVCGGLLLFAWMTDRKDRAARAGLDELPRVWRRGATSTPRRSTTLDGAAAVCARRAGFRGTGGALSPPVRGRASLGRGRFAGGTQTFGAATLDLKWALPRTDDAEL